MAVYRTIQMSFWTDPKLLDDFTPEDKYFYLYLMTNPYTNLLGCYEISLKQMSYETGYSKETVERLLDRFEEVHGVIEYSKATKEIYLKNWYKHNWTSSEKLDKPLIQQIETVKNPKFREELIGLLNQRDTLSIPYVYPMDTTNTVTNTNTVTVTDSISISSKEIIDYLNTKIGSHYRYQSTSTQGKIKARLNEGYTVDDFKNVIDKMVTKWGNDSKMSQYLRPETLFGNKFESYLNMQTVEPTDSTQEYISRWENV